ncbi:hypothetical protein GW17_00017738 [Ensete ventricosum]|nr:hypothetical protein GW17_00017738 [Ensete ventricosum]
MMLKFFHDDDLGFTAHDCENEQEKGIDMTPTAMMLSISMLALPEYFWSQKSNSPRKSRYGRITRRLGWLSRPNTMRSPSERPTNSPRIVHILGPMPKLDPGFMSDL